VLYPADFLPARLRPLLALNPLTGVMEGFRACLFPGRGVDLHMIAASLAVAFLLFVVGALYFRKAERTFADII
jgi:lipopolysaccharide transport system permease protein